ncbi:MAG: hypothetical protein O2819_08390 [Planctomycetota bacterium]|nr:hypothetical protein [Planctomycetota bacterium]MDA1106636.1 hypothetical protein [Planctomycetota bacterium]
MNGSPAAPLDLLRLKDDVERSRLFRELDASNQGLRCHAQGIDAWYEVMPSDRGWVVRLVIPDRWLSESIESDLVHGRDSLEALVGDELVDLGCESSIGTIRHFRDDQRQYVFEAGIPAPKTANDDDTTLALQFLLAFESTFRQLGNMSGEGGD